MSGDKDIVARNVASGTLLVDGKYKTAAETTATLENAFGDVVYDLGKDAIDSADLLLTDAGIVIGTGDTAQTIGASSVKVSESSKTLAEAQLGSVAFVTQGAEFVADEGMRSIRAAAKKARSRPSARWPAATTATKRARMLTSRASRLPSVRPAASTT